MPVILSIIFSFAAFAALLTLPSAGLLYLGKKNKIGAEQLLLTVIGGLMALAVALNWGTYGNVHGGAILLVLIMLASVPIVLSELMLLSTFRTKARLIQFVLVLLFPLALIYLASMFGTGG